MFKKCSSQNQVSGPLFQPDPLSLEHLQSHRGRWVRLLKRLWALQPRSGRRADVRPVASELFVPDGQLGLLIREGRPDRCFQSGRHYLDPGKAKLELRLIPAEVLRDQSSARLDLLAALPFERALLYVDGVQVALLKPGGPPLESLGALRPPVPRFLKEARAVRPALAGDEEDPLQHFSFV